ncbi:adenylate kinase isoenzyme 1 isoform X1 [Phlebotomus argentipes]|uniref:adenylate kinase isoenzyme 1 isoform X1 n=2 Tax=Phlebotomus argentipes TaxID=94469 RepID=UPI002892ED22|nr:adenylate kinase isoenzyme 1 isoform X1 [Phlebotomus argentipes]
MVFSLYCLFALHQMKMEQEAKEAQKSVQPNSSSGNGKEFKVPVVWILGGPGSGKGTQCDKIVAKYGFSHFSTGDLLREEVASGSDLGKELSALMQRGDLVQNEHVLALLEKAMLKVADSTVGYLIDGYPREKAQGAAFEQAIAPVDLILYLECAEDTMVQRILFRASQSAQVRADDNEATIKNRIHIFHTNTEEILSQYGEKVKRLPADRPIEEIFADVSKHLDELLAAKK